MRLAFLLVLALVALGVARGDFASGEARSEEAGPLYRAQAPADTTAQPLAADSTSEATALTRLRHALAPEAD